MPATGLILSSVPSSVFEEEDRAIPRCEALAILAWVESAGRCKGAAKGGLQGVCKPATFPAFSQADIPLVLAAR